MEAVEKTLTYRDNTGPYRKLLPGNKDKDKCNPKTKSDESNYVDLDGLLDMKSEVTKTVKVAFTGDGNQLAVFKCNSDTSGERSPGVREIDDNVDQIYEETSKDKWTDRPVSEDPPMDTSLTEFKSNVALENDQTTEPHCENVPRDYNVPSECEELQYTDMYLNSKTDDGESVVLSDHCAPDTVIDESHYITTHEIQLTELDHDVDYDFGRGTCWDIEDDNLVYSFVDYAPFESDETTEGTLIGLVDGKSQAKVKSSKAQCNNAHQSVAGCAVVSTESEFCDSDKCPSSDESICKNQNGSGNSAGQIHLSIKTSSRAINDSNNIVENENMCYRTKHVGDRSHFFFTSTDARAEALCDRSQYFIPAPGRQHFATKLRGKDVNEYSSGASSSISELDDADKEVRNLTAKSFRSLACPYFDAIHLSTSSESSMSEYGLGLNKWSAFVDLKYGNMSQGREQNLIAHKSATATFEMSKNADYKSIHGIAISNKKGPQTKMFSLNTKRSSPQHASSSTQNVEFTGPFEPGSEVITLTKTLNFRCNVEAGSPEPGMPPKYSENASEARFMDEVTGTLPAEPGYEVSYQHSDAGDTMEGTHKKASFASSLLKNVISKKMQFEQERKMERGEIRDTHPTHSPCFQCKDQDGIREGDTERGVHSQASESGSGYTSNSSDEQGAVDSRPNSSDPKEERTEALESFQTINKARLDSQNDACEPTRGSLSHSQNSAFKSWRDGEPEPQEEHEIRTVLDGTPSTTDNTGGRELDSRAVSSKLTKLSHLFVPSSQRLHKDTELKELVSDSTLPSAQKQQRGYGERKFRPDNNAGIVKGSKAPEIKIRLRSVKENKCNPLNSDNLLTPKISYPINSAGDSKYQVLPASDRVPHFTVRDIRDNKCKFQTPIHQVRDVRKLVKSSYRLVSVNNSESKGSVALAAASLREDNKASKKEPDKKSPPSSIVIKCQSVNTNSSTKQSVLVTEAPKQRQIENDRSSPKPSPECAKNEPTSLHRATGRPQICFAKQPNTDQSEAKQKQEKIVEAGERKPESKIPKQVALEKLKAAVKTMEQLYVFDRNEWKRKSQAPWPITDSHVLSLIAREEHGGPEELGAAGGRERLSTATNTDRLPETCNIQEEKGCLRIIHVPFIKDTFKTQSQQSKTFSNKSVFHLGNSIKTAVSSSSSNSWNGPQPCSPSHATSMVKSISSKTPKAPLSLKISPANRGLLDRGRFKSSPTTETPPQPIKSGNPDSENYLTIPVEGLSVGQMKLPIQEQVFPSSLAASQPGITDTKRPEHNSIQSLKRSPVVMETRPPDTPTTPTTATIYHHSLPVVKQGTPQPQVFCFSPSIAPLPTTPSGGDPFQPTQRKMLFDHTTGQYYLVDTPIEPVTRRLFDPETGQYVDVPMPMPQLQPVTPMSVSPLALNPGGVYAPTYMIYPGFLSPTLAAQTVMAPQIASHMASQLEDESGETTQGKYTLVQEGNMMGAESPYYSATGGSVPASVPVTLGHNVTTRGSAVTSEGKPAVISIMSQQRPRIIAPPSFDGTTMSFVVEHR
uniref:Chromosome 4 open reading frame 54 n=1 Tax=Hucho hucho TaxID=62062 RepID=A0A4W5QFN6_9TELE